ncbi:MAG: 50S ribosomal protein L25 [Bacteroides sp.]|nr:50S ribosomal protein L25 [Prevotella sp.]MCM1408346.1 50S ribosomal protein L25 [Treponema brennaborense]MCM1470422.1 50S ribosomal protein L25 [Bacteroides sp.]
MDQLVINANTRTVTGKVAAKKLRQNGRLPAVMYNSKGESVMLDIDEAEFSKIRKVATATTLVQLIVDGTSKNMSFIKDVEYDIISNKDLHADFHVVDENKPMKVTMKMQVSGTPVGVREGGTFVKGVQNITIRSLPADLPVRIVADVSGLAIGAALKVKDIPMAKGVEILSDSEAIVAAVR